MAYCCAERTNKEAAVAGKLMAVNFHHEQWRGLSLPLQHFRIKAVEKGIKRAHVEAENQTRESRPLTSEITRVMEEGIGEWGVGGRIVWVGLALTYQLLFRASELYAEEGRKVHEVYCLRRGDRCSLLRERGAPGAGKEEGSGHCGCRLQGGERGPGEKRGGHRDKGSRGDGEAAGGEWMVKLVEHYRGKVLGGRTSR